MIHNGLGIVELSVSRTISEIKQAIGRKSLLVHTPAFHSPAEGKGVFVEILPYHFVQKNYNSVATRWCKKFTDMFSHFNRILACNGRTNVYLVRTI